MHLYIIPSESTCPAPRSDFTEHDATGSAVRRLGRGVAIMAVIPRPFLVTLALLSRKEGGNS